MLDNQTMILLDGKFLSQKIFDDLSNKIQTLQTTSVPSLAVCLIGDNPASFVYVRNKIKACQKVGIKSIKKHFPASISKEDLKKEIEKLNQDSQVQALLIQLPLPQKFSEEEVLSWVDPKKDVDGLTLQNKALLWSGKAVVIPCTPKGILSLLSYYKIPIKGQKAVVVGRSQIVGLPLFQQLVSKNATVTLCHSHTKGLSDICNQADLVFACAGQRHLLSKKDFKKGAVVVDVGIHRGENKKLYGDVNPEGLETHLSALSPVPGGVGPMTIASLLENTILLTKKNHA